MQKNSPIIALVGTKSIRMKDILPALIEIGGKEALDDYMLNMAIEEELRNNSIVITPIEIRAERIQFLTMYNDISTPNFKKILYEKGYGPNRERQLLWRNAALRKLVAQDVKVTENSVKRMYEIIHGTSYPARVIVTTTHKEATDIFAKLNRGASFTKLAVELSIDPSASRGGIVDSIPIADPIWPAPIREALPKLNVGEFSSPIFIGDRWIIVQVTSAPVPSTVSFEQVKDEMQTLARLAQERFLMEEIAASLTKQQSITYFNSAFEHASRSYVD
jgi:hypothetical protein